MNKIWQLRFLELAEHISAWSKDPSTKVGAVIVSPNKQILSTGYNGFPQRIKDSEEFLHNRELKYSLMVHAELNAILNAAKNGVNINGAWLFVSGLPVCDNCAKHVAQSGITTIVMRDLTSMQDRWKESTDMAKTIFKLSDIPIIKL
jgi:dCMP deaminase